MLSIAMEIFTTYGGLAFWTDVMERLCVKAADHPSLREFFVRQDSSSRKEMQIALLDLMFGGGKTTEDVIARAHGSLAITEAAFQSFLSVFEHTLLEVSVESADVAYLLGLLAPQQGKVAQNSVV